MCQSVKGNQGSFTRAQQGLLVVFSGLNGAGKSTQIELLVDHLRQNEQNPMRVWTRVGSMAAVPEVPVSPHALLNTALAAVVGLMIGVGAGFLLECLEGERQPGGVREQALAPEVISHSIGSKQAYVCRHGVGDPGFRTLPAGPAAVKRCRSFPPIWNAQSHSPCHRPV